MNSGSNTAASVEFPGVSEDLFIDKISPASEREQSEPTGVNIQAFLEKKYDIMGFQDGYSYHNLEMLNNQVKTIKAEFRLQLDLVIDQRRRTLLDLRTHSIEVEGLSERMGRQIEAVEKDFSAMIDRLEKEKDLSVCDEGWVMRPVNNYRYGFLRGVERYNEERLIAGCTGLFN